MNILIIGGSGFIGKHLINNFCKQKKYKVFNLDILNFKNPNVTKNYIGDIKDLNLLLAKVSIFVLPSYYSEGLPKVLLEAAASGCPIVTTDHPGCRDAIVNNKTGILVEIRNPKVLKSAISNLLAEPNKLISMGKASRNLAEELFDEKKVIEAHYALYEKYANKPS